MSSALKSSNINMKSLHKRVLSRFSLANSSGEKDTWRKTLMSDDSFDSLNEEGNHINNKIPESKKTAFMQAKNDSVERLKTAQKPAV